jgi:hypothetical protein
MDKFIHSPLKFSPEISISHLVVLLPNGYLSVELKTCQKRPKTQYPHHRLYTRPYKEVFGADLTLGIDAQEEDVVDAVSADGSMVVQIY